MAMNEFMKILLSLSASGTLLLFLISGLKLLYRNKFSRRWQYYIWITAALRFLIPFAPGVMNAGEVFKIKQMPIKMQTLGNAAAPVIMDNSPDIYTSV